MPFGTQTYELGRRDGSESPHESDVDLEEVFDDESLAFFENVASKMDSGELEAASSGGNSRHIVSGGNSRHIGRKVPSASFMTGVVRSAYEDEPFQLWDRNPYLNPNFDKDTQKEFIARVERAEDLARAEGEFESPVSISRRNESAFGKATAAQAIEPPPDGSHVPSNSFSVTVKPFEWPEEDQLERNRRRFSPLRQGARSRRLSRISEKDTGIQVRLRERLQPFNVQPQFEHGTRHSPSGNHGQQPGYPSNEKRPDMHPNFERVPPRFQRPDFGANRRGGDFNPRSDLHKNKWPVHYTYPPIEMDFTPYGFYRKAEPAHDKTKIKPHYIEEYPQKSPYKQYFDHVQCGDMFPGSPRASRGGTKTSAKPGATKTSSYREDLSSPIDFAKYYKKDIDYLADKRLPKQREPLKGSEKFHDGPSYDNLPMERGRVAGCHPERGNSRFDNGPPYDVIKSPNWPPDAKSMANYLEMAIQADEWPPNPKLVASFFDKEYGIRLPRDESADVLKCRLSTRKDYFSLLEAYMKNLAVCFYHPDSGEVVVSAKQILEKRNHETGKDCYVEVRLPGAMLIGNNDYGVGLSDDPSTKDLVDRLFEADKVRREHGGDARDEMIQRMRALMQREKTVEAEVEDARKTINRDNEPWSQQDMENLERKFETDPLDAQPLPDVPLDGVFDKNFLQGTSEKDGNGIMAGVENNRGDVNNTRGDINNTRAGINKNGRESADEDDEFPAAPEDSSRQAKLFHKMKKEREAEKDAKKSQEWAPGKNIQDLEKEKPAAENDSLPDAEKESDEEKESLEDSILDANQDSIEQVEDDKDSTNPGENDKNSTEQGNEDVQNQGTAGEEEEFAEHYAPEETREIVDSQTNTDEEDVKDGSEIKNSSEEDALQDTKPASSEHIKKRGREKSVGAKNDLPEGSVGAKDEIGVATRNEAVAEQNDVLEDPTSVEEADALSKARDVVAEQDEDRGVNADGSQDGDVAGNGQPGKGKELRDIPSKESNTGKESMHFYPEKRAYEKSPEKWAYEKFDEQVLKESDDEEEEDDKNIALNQKNYAVETTIQRLNASLKDLVASNVSVKPMTPVRVGQNAGKNAIANGITRNQAGASMSLTMKHLDKTSPSKKNNKKKNVVEAKRKSAANSDFSNKKRLLELGNEFKRKTEIAKRLCANEAFHPLREEASPAKPAVEKAPSLKSVSYPPEFLESQIKQKETVLELETDSEMYCNDSDSAIYQSNFDRREEWRDLPVGERSVLEASPLEASVLESSVVAVSTSDTAATKKRSTSSKKNRSSESEIPAASSIAPGRETGASSSIQVGGENSIGTGESRSESVRDEVYERKRSPDKMTVPGIAGKLPIAKTTSLPAAGSGKKALRKSSSHHKPNVHRSTTDPQSRVFRWYPEFQDEDGDDRKEEDCWPHEAVLKADGRDWNRADNEWPHQGDSGKGNQNERDEKEDWNQEGWSEENERNPDGWNSWERNDCKSKDWQEGERQEGDWQEGEWQEGDWQEGEWQEGEWQEGDWQEGDCQDEDYRDKNWTRLPKSTADLLDEESDTSKSSTNFLKSCPGINARDCEGQKRREVLASSEITESDTKSIPEMIRSKVFLKSRRHLPDGGNLEHGGMMRAQTSKAPTSKKGIISKREETFREDSPNDRDLNDLDLRNYLKRSLESSERLWRSYNSYSPRTFLTKHLEERRSTRNKINIDDYR